MELTEEQKKMAAQWEEQQRQKQAKHQELVAMKEQCEAEAHAIAKWLLSQEMKPRKTQLVVKD